MSVKDTIFLSLVEYCSSFLQTYPYTETGQQSYVYVVKATVEELKPYVNEIYQWYNVTLKCLLSDVSGCVSRQWEASFVWGRKMVFTQSWAMSNHTKIIHTTGPSNVHAAALYSWNLIHAECSTIRLIECSGKYVKNVDLKCLATDLMMSSSKNFGMLPASSYPWAPNAERLRCRMNSQHKGRSNISRDNVQMYVRVDGGYNGRIAVRHWKNG